MDAISEGHYYRKQLGCKSSVIAWSHRSRFKVGLRLIGPTSEKLLDYGCGDGTFLAMAADRIREGLGADIATNQVLECQTRFAEYGNLRFCTIGELDASCDATFDTVTCMETLEHCTAPIVEVVLRDLARLVKPNGRIIISVPIEIGPSFLIKYIIRKIAAWRGLGDYRYYESYSLRNAIRMLFADRHTSLIRPVYGETESPTHSHYGFNWRALRERIRTHLTIERIRFSPLGFLGGWFSSQVWFICKPHEKPSDLVTR